MIHRAITSIGMSTQVGFTQLSLTSFEALRFISILNYLSAEYRKSAHFTPSKHLQIELWTRCFDVNPHEWRFEILTGIVWLPCKLVIAAWASGCEANFTNAQPAKINRRRETVSKEVVRSEAKNCFHLFLFAENKKEHFFSFNSTRKWKLKTPKWLLPLCRYQQVAEAMCNSANLNVLSSRIRKKRISAVERRKIRKSQSIAL